MFIDCRRLAGALLLALPALSAWAEPPLTLDQALQLAQQRSLQIGAQDAAAAGAREQAVAAGQLPDPTLRVSVDSLPINGPNRFSLVRDDFTQSTVGVTQELTRSAKRQARAARFEREADVAEANRTLALATVQRQTALAWLERHYQESMRGALHASAMKRSCRSMPPRAPTAAGAARRPMCSRRARPWPCSMTASTKATGKWPTPSRCWHAGSATTPSGRWPKRR